MFLYTVLQDDVKLIRQFGTDFAEEFRFSSRNFSVAKKTDINQSFWGKSLFSNVDFTLIFGKTAGVDALNVGMKVQPQKSSQAQLFGQ